MKYLICYDIYLCIKNPVLHLTSSKAVTLILEHKILGDLQSVCILLMVPYLTRGRTLFHPRHNPFKLIHRKFASHDDAFPNSLFQFKHPSPSSSLNPNLSPDVLHSYQTLPLCPPNRDQRRPPLDTGTIIWLSLTPKRPSYYHVLHRHALGYIGEQKKHL